MFNEYFSDEDGEQRKVCAVHSAPLTPRPQTPTTAKGVDSTEDTTNTVTDSATNSDTNSDVNSTPRSFYHNAIPMLSFLIILVFYDYFNQIEGFAEAAVDKLRPLWATSVTDTDSMLSYVTHSVRKLLSLIPGVCLRD